MRETTSTIINSTNWYKYNGKGHSWWKWQGEEEPRKPMKPFGKWNLC